jgi:hypothetical protein
VRYRAIPCDTGGGAARFRLGSGAVGLASGTLRVVVFQ